MAGFAGSSSQPPVLHTFQRYWTKARFVKLLVFALILGNVTAYCITVLSRHQVLSSAVTHHSKVFTAYLQAVERARLVITKDLKEPETALNESIPDPSGEAEALSNFSPYWTALLEVRRQFPFYKVALVLQESPEGTALKSVFDQLQRRPRGWNATREDDGWARSFFSLPTKNMAAFQVDSYVRDELSGWEITSLVMGAYAFCLLVAFGWFWTRAMDDALQRSTTQAAEELDRVRKEFHIRVQALNEYSEEMSKVLEEVQHSLQSLSDSDVVDTIAEQAGQIRQLALNGMLEASRSVEMHQVFYALMQEIERVSVHQRELVSKLKTDFVECVQIQEAQDRLGSLSTSPEAPAKPSGKTDAKSFQIAS